MSDPITNFLLNNGYTTKQSHGRLNMFSSLFNLFSIPAHRISKRLAKKILDPVREEILKNKTIDKNLFFKISFNQFEHPRKWDYEYIAFCRSKDFFKSQKWKNLRLKVLAKGAYCRACGATSDTGAVLHIDHIYPRSIYPEMALDESNLQVLCADCNFGKGNTIIKDFR